MKKYLACLRIPHYLKNLIVFLPLFFNKSICNGGLLLKTLGGFVVFCCLSSSIYIINDINDIDYDRLHEKKKNRSIASGEVEVRKAIVLAISLVVSGFLVCFLIRTSWVDLIWPMLYFVINVIYSMGGKHIPIFDISILSAGYPIRLIYGGEICGISISRWLFLTVICISLFLGIGKRRGEYNREGNITRPVLEKYNQSWLDGELYMTLGLGIMFYSLWAVEKSINLVYTVPIVLVISMYYSFIITNKNDGDPINTFIGN